MLRRTMFLGFAALLTLNGSQARADIRLDLVGGAPTGTGPFSYTYNVFLEPRSALVPAGGGLNTTGDFFTIYDFSGLIGTPTTTLTGFLPPTVQAPGITPATQNPPDTGLLNVTFRDQSNTTSNTGSTEVLLGTVTLVSTFPLDGRNTFYSGATQDAATNSVIANNTNQVLGPAVPEPASVAMLGTGLVAVLGLGLRRRKKV